MRQIVTKDGSITLFSNEYDENYHSLSGAREEAFKKYVEASPYKEFSDKGKIKILDVCFGLGYNSAAALDRIREFNPDCVVTLVGLENDPEVLCEILSLNPEFKSYQVIKAAIKDKNRYEDDKIKLQIIVADARGSIKLVGNDFDMVFHDPFSPKKCSVLWTEEFFKELITHLKKGGVLTTYSCARQVRDNLRKAGFSVRDGPCVGRRAPSTIAVVE